MASVRDKPKTRAPEKLETFCTLAAMAEAVTGPMPGMLISLRALSSAFAMALITSSA